MFAPTKVWRRWHRRINQNQRRYATVSALAATALPSLVMARGHRVDSIQEVPLVVTSALEKVSRTKEAITVLKALGAYADVQKVKGQCVGCTTVSVTTTPLNPAPNDSHSTS